MGLSSFKDSVRARLSSEQLIAIRRVRAWAEKFRLPVLSAKALSGLGATTAAEVKERLSPVGKLDYAPADIFLMLESRSCLVRLTECAKEPDTVAWLERTFRAGDVLYDVGANVGTYSFVACAVAGGNCTVYAFEPSFSTYATLSQNILLNGRSHQIAALQVALADSTGIRSFRYAKLAAGASTHRGIDDDGDDELPEDKGTDAPGPNGTGNVQQLLTYRLDELVRQFELRPPTHMKIDVDGPELAVLIGAGDIIEQPALRSVLVEVDEIRYPRGEIPALLEDAGFQLTGSHPRRTPNSANLIFERR